MRSSEPVKTTVLPATGESLAAFSASRTVDLPGQLLDQLAVVALAEIAGNRVDHRLADLVDGVHLLARRLVAGGDLHGAASWKASHEP